MSEKLKPCPFCGQRGVLRYEQCGDAVIVVCDTCGFSGSFGADYKEAAYRWNRRAEVKGDGTAS